MSRHFATITEGLPSFERAHQVKLPEDIAVLVRQGFRDRYPRKEKVLTADGRPLDSPEDYNLVKRLRDAGTPLEQYIKTQPFFGIKTAPTDVFVVDRKIRGSTDCGTHVVRGHSETVSAWQAYKTLARGATGTLVNFCLPRYRN